MRLLSFLLLFLLPGAPAGALLLDGDGGEHPIVVDDSADGGLLRVSATAAGDGLWIGLEFEEDVHPGSGSGLVLHLDADGSADTGDEHGCDLVFDLQSRNGAHHPDRELPGEGRLFSRLGLKVAPAFASQRAEILLPRSIRGGATIFGGDGVRLFIVHEGDRAPDAGMVRVSWTAIPDNLEAIGLGRGDGTRLVSWNVERDGLFDEERAGSLRRILRRLDADVLVIGESFRHDGAEVRDRVGQLGVVYPHVVKADPGNVILSRFPIADSWPIIDGPDRHNGHRLSAALLETPAGPFLVVAAHWRCCRKEDQRLFEADATVGFLRDLFTEGGNVGLPEPVPFVVCGDLNLVDTRRPLDVVLTGVVTDKDSYGPDFAPGPGGTELRAVPLRHAEAPFTHTWRDAGSKYYPARLDWVLAPSNVRMLKGFVLDTGRLRSETLSAHALQRRDSLVASDHLPVVVDLAW